MRNLFNLIVVTICINVCASKADDSILIQNDICSGERATETLEILTLKCDGDYTLSGGTITTDKKLIIISGGSIAFDNLLIFADEIEVRSPIGITIGEQALLSATSSVSYIILGKGNLTIMGDGTTITEGVTLSSNHGITTTEGSIMPATNGFTITPGSTIITEGTLSSSNGTTTTEGSIVPATNGFTITPVSTITIESTLSPNGMTTAEGVTDGISYTGTSEASPTSSSDQVSSGSGAGMINFWNFVFLIIFISIFRLCAMYKRYFGKRNNA